MYKVYIITRVNMGTQDIIYIIGFYRVYLISGVNMGTQDI